MLEILEAFERLGLVILGAELWRFNDDSSGPTVVGWTQFEVSQGSWNDRVIESSRLAADDLRGHAGSLDVWVQLSWDTADDAAF